MFKLKNLFELGKIPILNSGKRRASNIHPKKVAICFVNVQSFSIQSHRPLHNQPNQLSDSQLGFSHSHLNSSLQNASKSLSTSPDSSFTSSLDPSLIPPLDSSLIPSLEPSLASLGLGGWFPKGLIQQGLELLHVNLGVPWWTAIILGTLCLRILIFPLMIASQRNMANLNNHMPTIQRFQDRISNARATGNIEEMTTSSNEMMKFMATNNVNPLKNMLVPLAQIPIFLSVFTGLREMTSLPVTSMQSGGLWWFSDLTVPDPMWALPALTALTLLITVETGIESVKANQIGSTSIKWFLRAMPFISLPVMINFPSAMLCYWFTSNSFSLLLAIFFRQPSVRSFFEIPPLVDHSQAFTLRKGTQAPQPSFMESFKQSMENIELARKIEERERLKSLKLKQTPQEEPADQKVKKETRFERK